MSLKISIAIFMITGIILISGCVHEEEKIKQKELTFETVQKGMGQVDGWIKKKIM